MQNGVLDIYNLSDEFKFGFMVEEEGVLVTPIARLSFPHLFERNTFKGTAGDGQSKPSFSATLLFNCQNASAPGLVDINRVVMPRCTEVVSQYWGSKQKPIPWQYFHGLHDGRQKQGMEGYGEGVWFISAKNHSQTISNVTVVDANRRLIGPNEIKAGDFVRARVRPYIPTNYDNKGVSWALMSIQLVIPWEGFGSKQDTGDEWGTVPVPTQAPVQGFDY